MVHLRVQAISGLAIQLITSVSLGVLEIPKSDLVILYRSATRHNLFLQVRPTNLRMMDDVDDTLSFLIPIFMDKRRPKVQIFVSGPKLRHNLVCKLSQIIEHHL